MLRSPLQNFISFGLVSIEFEFSFLLAVAELDFSSFSFFGRYDGLE
jgi:hypothetical protein